MADKTNPWERLDEENEKAFDCFCLYREMAVNRTLEKVAKTLGMSANQMGVYSAAHNWVERARAYDAHLDRLFLKERDKAIVAMRRRQIRTMLSAQELITDQLDKHMTWCARVNEPQIPINHLAKLAGLAHADERVNRDLPDSIIKMQSDAIDLSCYTPEELKEWKRLLNKAKPKDD